MKRRSSIGQQVLAFVLVLAAAGRPAAAADTLELDGATIVGNRELPKALFIVPWKSSAPGELTGRPMNSLVNETLEPVDRDVFLREFEYYKAVHGIAGELR